MNADYRELYDRFATKEDLRSINQYFARIDAKLDLFIPRDTHTKVWEEDAKWKKEARDDIEELKRMRVPQLVITIIGWLITLAIAFFSAATKGTGH